MTIEMTKRLKNIHYGCERYHDITADLPQGPTDLLEFGELCGTMVRDIFSGAEGVARQARCFQLLENGYILHHGFAGLQCIEAATKMWAT